MGDASLCSASLLLPAMQQTGVQSMDQKDPLEEGMATHSSILPWRIPRTEEPGGVQSMGPQESDMTERLMLSRLKHSPK